MLTSLLLVASALTTLVAASPASKFPGAPAGFDPTHKYPKPKGGRLRQPIAGGGAFLNSTTTHSHRSTDTSFVKRAAEIASRFTHLVPRQPQWGPGSYVTNGDALQWYNGDFNAGTGGVDPNQYSCYGGNVWDFPPIWEWMGFWNMFDRNQQAEMAYTPDSGEQQGEIYNAIVEISQATLVDARLILAVIMQESSANVYVPCTAGYNCGLMQANHGSVSYNPGNGIPDSQASINQMVMDGTEGTWQGPGYVQYLNGGSDYAYTNCPLGNPWAAARAYNTGSCSPSGNMHCALYGTASYVNDIANRLVGWNGYGSPQWQCGFPAVGSGC